MRKPTPVTISIITAESASMRNATSAWNGPAAIHGVDVCVETRALRRRPAAAATDASATTNDSRRTASGDAIFTTPRPRARRRPRSGTPSSGSAGISQSTAVQDQRFDGLVHRAHQRSSVELVGVDRLAVAERRR